MKQFWYDLKHKFIKNIKHLLFRVIKYEEKNHHVVIQEVETNYHIPKNSWHMEMFFIFYAWELLLRYVFKVFCFKLHTNCFINKCNIEYEKSCEINSPPTEYNKLAGEG